MTTTTDDKYEQQKRARGTTAPVFKGCVSRCVCRCNNAFCACHEKE